MAVPYSFAAQTGSIPLSQLDSNFSTAITLGNTAVVLGNTYSTLGNLTLSNVTISSGNVTVNVSNVSTINTVTLTVTGNETVGGNVTITGNVSVNVANVTTLNATSSTITGNETVGGNVSITGNVTANVITAKILTSPSATNLTLQSAGITAVTVDTSQNVGIGATSIAANTRLLVSGGRTNLVANSDAYALGVGYASAGAYYLGANSSNNALIFSNSSGSEVARFDSSGNLGLGVTPSAWQSYTAFQMNSGAILSYSTNDYRMVGNTLRSGGAFKYINTAPALMYLQDTSGGTHQWYIAPSGTAGNTITFTQAMTLDTNGMLVLGSTSALQPGGSPSTRGEVSINGSTDSFVSFGIGGTVKGYIGQSSTGLQLDTEGSTAITFVTNGAERMRIDSSGNLLVGGTTSSGVLTITAASTSSAISIRSGASELSRTVGQTATSVSTSATNILPVTFGYGALAIVNGYSGGNTFNDLVFFGNTTATAVTSQTSGGSPAARTYTVASGQLKLAMASGTYTVTAVQQYINSY